MMAVKELWEPWSVVKPLLTIKNERDYQQAIRSMNELIDEVGTNQKHPLYDLLDTLGTLLHVYEEEHYQLPDVPAREIVQHFMEEYTLTQSDLPEIGSQGVVSEILSGKRELNLRQVKALAQRFKVSPNVFL